MAYGNKREEEIKNKVAQDYFSDFDCTQIIGNLDFCVTVPESEEESLLWAEAKQGNKADIYESFVQLILTIGKARTFDKFLPPAFLGAFDAEKIAFIEYNQVQDIFYLNDFNWNVTPSNHDTKEFKQILGRVKTTLESNSTLFFFGEDNMELNEFIQSNFVLGKSSTSKIQIDKNNFMVIYSKWLNAVKPTINANWENAKKKGIIDGDFYLADLLSHENETLKVKLYVLLKKDHYELDRIIDEDGFFNRKSADFNDHQKAHVQFWNKYKRPPKEVYWDYMVARRDLLVPQDVRERKGSFFTPQIWVELSQKYLADVLGEDWQDEYYIWDCAAGTGNLLNGLTNKTRIWASTLDRQDVDVMKDRIQNGANLLEGHVFQFDFLNDSFDKLPKNLQNIINDPEKRKKLIIYINPPYAEAATARRKGNKQGVSENKAKAKYQAQIGNAVNELFTQFFALIYDKCSESILAQFSTLKIVQAPNFAKFRQFFQAHFQKGFIVPATSFDNVKGQFPIGFMIWDLKKKVHIKKIACDIMDKEGNRIGKKKIFATDSPLINGWYKQFYDNQGKEIGIMNTRGNDFQNQNYIYISSINNFNHTNLITPNNLIPTCIYYAVRRVITTNWQNNRDQFLHPNKKWEKDTEFQNDCLTYALFHGQNKISCKEGTNHWIPFTENEVNAKEAFESNFMTDFMAGKIKREKNTTMFETEEKIKRQKLEFSDEAKAVFQAGKALWTYYLQQSDCNVNASFYDIREYFQERNENGKMNNKSSDETYSDLLKVLREKIQILETKIQPKVYEYGFLKD